MSTSAATVTCRSCGAEIEGSVLLCPKCGQPNISTEFATTEYYPATEPIPEEQAMAPPTLAPEPLIGESVSATTVVIAPTPARHKQPGSSRPGYSPMGAPPSGYPPASHPPQQATYSPPGYQPRQLGYVSQRAAGRSFPVWGWVLIAAVVVIVAAAVALGLMVSGAFVSRAEQAVTSDATPIMVSYVSPSETVIKFYDALGFGEYTAARGYLDSSLAAENSEESLMSRWTALAGGGAVVYVLGRMEIQADSANIGLTFYAPSGTKTVDLSLAKIGNDWMITEANPDIIPSP